MADSGRSIHRAEQDVIEAARAIADSFTAASGNFIHDDLTYVEWAPLREALDHLDETKRGA